MLSDGGGNGEILTQIGTISTAAYPTGRRISHGGRKSSFAGRRYRLPDRKTAGLSPASPSTSRHTSGGNHDSSRGSLARLAYIAENTYGTTPTTRRSSRSTRPATPGSGKDTFQSETIRSDRQLVDFRHGVRQSNGDIGFEFRAVSLRHAAAEAALMGTWSTNTLKAGTARRSFTFERYFADIGRYRRTA